MTRFEVMSERQARQIVEDSRRALAAILRGDTKSADARAMSFQSESYEDRLAAYRRLQRVVTADERARITALRESQR